MEADRQDNRSGEVEEQLKQVAWELDEFNRQKAGGK